MTNPLLHTTQLGYDDASRITMRVLPNMTLVTTGYDGDGNRTSVAPPGKPEHRFDFDPFGLLERYRPPAIGASDDSTWYDLNADRQLERILRPGDRGVAFHNDQASGVRVARDSWAPGSALRSASYEYDPASGRLSAMETADVRVDFDYLGDVLVSETWSGEIAGAVSRALDADGRLVAESVNGVESVSFAYDQDGLLLSAAVAIGGMEIERDPLTGLVTAVEAGAISSTWTHNELGEPVSAAHGKTSQTLLSLVHQRDALGRVQQEAESGLEPVAELDGQGNVAAVFVHATREHSPDAMRRSGATYRVLTDHLGSVRLVVDAATGAVAQRRDYDEFGNVLLDTGPGFQPLGFAGGIHDPATGLVRFGVRDYDPATGRWTAKDPIRFDGGDANQFTYVLLDPVNIVDLNGEAPNGWRRLGRALVLLGRLFWGGQGYEPPPPPPPRPPIERPGPPPPPGAPPPGASWMPPIPMGLLCSIPGMSSAPECAEYCPEDCCL